MSALRNQYGRDGAEFASRIVVNHYRSGFNAGFLYRHFFLGLGNDFDARHERQNLLSMPSMSIYKLRKK